MKRLLDLAIAVPGLVIAIPVIAVAAILIRASSKGPAILAQTRVGHNGVPFTCYKLRTMYADTPAVPTHEAQRSAVTPPGRILRATKLDELPQLWNVLRGEMSIVGPRPHALAMKVGDAYYHEAVRGYAGRHRVRPGITGLAQVRGLRGEIDTIERAKKRVEYDVYYIENWSPLLDLRIILETIFKLVWDRNAY